MHGHRMGDSEPMDWMGRAEQPCATAGKEQPAVCREEYVTLRAELSHVLDECGFDTGD